MLKVRYPVMVLLMVLVSTLAALAPVGEAHGKLRRSKAKIKQVSREIVSLGATEYLADPRPSAAVESCCPPRCISYRYHHGKKACCGCEPPVQTVLSVKEPCCCCPVEVPVCLPACCMGCPKVHSRCGHLGRSVVTYKWCCGYKVRIVFRRCGDVVVHYYGK